MTPDELEQLKYDIKTTLTQVVVSTVNGKIDAISRKLDLYIQEDTAWKTTAEPVIEMGNNARGASIVALWLAGVIVAIGGAWRILYKIFLKK